MAERDGAGHAPRRPRDRTFAPVLRTEDEQASEDVRERGRKATGTGVPTEEPAESGADAERDTVRSSDEGPPIGTSAHEDEPKP